MPSSDTLASLRQQLLRGEISAPELIRQTIAQIESQNPKINAFIETYFDEALRQAEGAQQRIQKKQARPLEGLPLTIKDSIDIAGRPTACGSLLYCDVKPAHDATCVRLLRDAGAIVIGKTSCPEFLMNYETDNRLIGRTNNPWDATVTPGGSSGGEAAAIASFCSVGGVGSDGGGSVRFPAHCCGIAGLKPTPGRISAAGHVPPIAHPGGLLGVVGPMARTAEDVNALFEVLVQYDIADPFSAPVPRRPADLELFKKKQWKIGVMHGWLDVPVEPAMAEAVLKAASVLSDLGYVTEEFRPRGVERAPNLWWFFFGQIHSRVTAASLKGKESKLHWTGLELLEHAMSESEPSVERTLINFAARDAMRIAMLQQMDTCRVLLLPASGVVAFPHRTRRWQTPKKEIGLFEAMMPLTPFNLFGMPSMVIPFGLNERGLPCGIQLVGRSYDEETLLAIAIEMERARGPFPTPLERRSS
jgi:Asp-tRNA(Asn)/Glu-tRNA(Gln) amidotransferase A subunit family amidase